MNEMPAGVTTAQRRVLAFMLKDGIELAHQIIADEDGYHVLRFGLKRLRVRGQTFKALRKARYLVRSAGLRDATFYAITGTGRAVLRDGGRA